MIKVGDILEITSDKVFGKITYWRNYSDWLTNNQTSTMVDCQGAVVVLDAKLKYFAANGEQLDVIKLLTQDGKIVYVYCYLKDFRGYTIL